MSRLKQLADEVLATMRRVTPFDPTDYRFIVEARPFLDLVEVARATESRREMAERLLADVLRVAKARHIPDGWAAIEEAEKFLGDHE